eukprot:TRINITY_DN5829_c0_g4_i2.p1 TRINITY_DN5829_c0_g4~~TRINITY_DN5829_c0_g4_i2.p1  ORF type:complete len:382 (-),score=23.23 TRINITY_DN5829_c0_g4_i2:255-1400(-)
MPCLPCKHGRRPTRCKECGGCQICPHGRERYVCQDCGGGGRCLHGRAKTRCRDCHPLCKHRKRVSRCELCRRGPSRDATPLSPVRVSRGRSGGHVSRSGSLTSGGSQIESDSRGLSSVDQGSQGEQPGWDAILAAPLDPIGGDLAGLLDSGSAPPSEAQARHRTLGASLMLRIREDASVLDGCEDSPKGNQKGTGCLAELLEVHPAEMMADLQWIPDWIYNPWYESSEPKCLLVWVMGVRRCFTNNAWHWCYPTITGLELDELFETNHMHKSNPLCRAGLFPLAGIVDPSQHAFFGAEIWRDMSNATQEQTPEGVHLTCRSVASLRCTDTTGAQAIRRVSVESCYKAGGTMTASCITVTEVGEACRARVIAGASSEHPIHV